MHRKFIGYFVNHFRGDHSLAWSFFVNGILFYLLVTATILLVAYKLSRWEVSTDLSLVVFAVFAAWFLWAIVGNIRAAIKVLRSHDRGLAAKAFALLVILAVGVFAAYLANDVFRLYVQK